MITKFSTALREMLRTPIHRVDYAQIAPFRLSSFHDVVQRNGANVLRFTDDSAADPQTAPLIELTMNTDGDILTNVDLFGNIGPHLVPIHPRTYDRIKRAVAWPAEGSPYTQAYNEVAERLDWVARNERFLAEPENPLLVPSEAERLDWMARNGRFFAEPEGPSAVPQK